MVELRLSTETIYYLAFGLAMAIIGTVLYYVFNALFGATPLTKNSATASLSLYAMAVFFSAAVAGAALVILLNIYKIIRGE